MDIPRHSMALCMWKRDFLFEMSLPSRLPIFLQSSNLICPQSPMSIILRCRRPQLSRKLTIEIKKNRLLIAPLWHLLTLDDSQSEFFTSIPAYGESVGKIPWLELYCRLNGRMTTNTQVRPVYLQFETTEKFNMIQNSQDSSIRINKIYELLVWPEFF